MASTIGDLYTYARALATCDGLLNPATQAQRLQFVQTNVPGLVYGLGIFRVGSFLGHDGEVPGYDAIMLYSPSQKATLIAIGTTSPDFDNLPQTSKLSTFQVIRKLYPLVYPGQTLGAAAGVG